MNTEMNGVILTKHIQKYTKIYKKKVGYISTLVFDLIQDGEKDIIFKLSSYSKGYMLKIGGFHSMSEENDGCIFTLDEIDKYRTCKSENILVSLLEERISYVDNHIEILKSFRINKEIK